MRCSTTYLSATDGTPLFVRLWEPDGEPVRGIIQIAHGMAEHSARYERFAQAATSAGYVVVADDHRGHGGTAPATTLGHCDDADGWNRVIEDLETVYDFAASHWPGLPIIVFGHSWGSLLVRGWAMRHGGQGRLAGLIIMGTAGDPGALGVVGIALARAQVRLMGARHRSALLESQAFATHNKAFAPARTDFDWLSRDEAEVDRYIADPQCGMRCTAAFYRDLAVGAREVNQPGAFQLTPWNLPVLVTSGEEDPVGGMGVGVRQVADGLAEAGLRDVTVHLYPGARHELLNEVNRDEVTADLLAWIGERVEAFARRIEGEQEGE